VLGGWFIHGVNPEANSRCPFGAERSRRVALLRLTGGRAVAVGFWFAGFAEEVLGVAVGVGAVAVAVTFLVAVDAFGDDFGGVGEVAGDADTFVKDVEGAVEIFALGLFVFTVFDDAAVELVNVVEALFFEEA